MPDCIGVKFDNGPKVHYVELAAPLPALGSSCVVSTKRGRELATVRTELRQAARPIGRFLAPASPDDLARKAQLDAQAEDLKWLLRARARERGDKLKIIKLEFNLDGNLLVVSYSSDKQAPLQALTQLLMGYTSARIEFNNVGPRDQARILGTLGVCGSGSCSSTWIQSFNAVGIRMARDQQLPLNPEKISGPCGRLMCCLQYEHEMYKTLLKGMPKKGSKACHESSGVCGRVVKLNPLKQSVDIKTDEGNFEEIPVAELVPAAKRR